MSRYDNLKEYNVILRPNAEPDAVPSREIIAVIYATDVDDVKQQADELVATLNNLVTVHRIVLRDR